MGKKSYATLEEENKELRAELVRKRDQAIAAQYAYDELQAKLSDPASYVEGILKRGIDWYDYLKLDQAQQFTYFGDAKQIANGMVFNNELDRYIADLIKFCAYEVHDQNALMNVRASIVALETFRKRLEAIQDPTRPNKEADPFDAI